MDRALTPPLWAFTRNTDTTSGPPRKPRHSPVFIYDAVTPWGQETVLLKLLREQAADQDE